MNNHFRRDDYLSRDEIAECDRRHRERWPGEYIVKQSKEQDAIDAATHCPEIETAARHRQEQRLLDEIAAAERIEVDLDIIDVADWEGDPVPIRQWAVRDWIPMHAVTLVAGKGGTGKSLALQQWLSAVSVGAEFMGMCSTAPYPCLYVNCEDTADELHIRQAGIAIAMARSLGGFRGSMHTLPRIGRDNALGVMDDKGKFQHSELYLQIRAEAKRLGIRGICLDNAMQMFVGNANDNGEVTCFLNALTALAMDIDGFVLLAAHTAKSDGSEFMGCMAWENGVRSRLWLLREADEEGQEIEDSNVRILTRKKANYAAKGASVEMAWKAEAFHRVDRTAEDGSDARAEAAFLACLDKATADRRNVSHSPSANYAPTVFAGMKEASKIRKPALEKAMQRLFDRGEIIANEPLWKDDQRRQKYGLARCPNSRPNPRPQTVPKPPEPCAQARPHTPIYTTYMGAGPDGPPPPDENEYLATRDADFAHADEMGWEADDD